MRTLHRELAIRQEKHLKSQLKVNSEIYYSQRSTALDYVCRIILIWEYFILKLAKIIHINSHTLVKIHRHTIIHTHTHDSDHYYLEMLETLSAPKKYVLK